MGETEKKHVERGGYTIEGTGSLKRKEGKNKKEGSLALQLTKAHPKGRPNFGLKRKYHQGGSKSDFYFLGSRH